MNGQIWIPKAQTRFCNPYKNMLVPAPAFPPGHFLFQPIPPHSQTRQKAQLCPPPIALAKGGQAKRSFSQLPRLLRIHPFFHKEGDTASATDTT